MRLFHALLVLLVLSLAGALAWALAAAEPGQVFIRYRGWDIQTSVPYAVLLVGLAVLALWLLAKLLLMPLRAWRRHRHRLTRSRLVDGLLALHEGRWARAEQLLRRVAGQPRLRVPALIGASRAADGRGDAAAADARLAELDAAALSPGERSAVDLAAADRAFAHGDHAQALQRLEATLARGALPPRGQRLRAELLLALGRPIEAVATLPAIRASKAVPAGELPVLEARLHAAALAAAGDSEALRAQWSSLAPPTRQQPAIVAAYAQRAAALGLEDAALDAVREAIGAGWSEDLVLLFGLLPPPREDHRLRQAEDWLQAHPSSPALLVTLGRLCRTQSLWGKAADYLHRAIAQGAGSEAWEALGHVLAAQGDDARSRISYANALRVARAEAVMELPGRGLRQKILDEAVAEERDEHGLPRLPLP